ncbi:MAG: Rne/Rng family ribonuclease [Nocardioidaceae bacterium]|nr:Rne/Rng family ribonuclease [Nocardioidaceae bacterium]
MNDAPTQTPDPADQGSSPDPQTPDPQTPAPQTPAPEPSGSEPSATEAVPAKKAAKKAPSAKKAPAKKAPAKKPAAQKTTAKAASAEEPASAADEPAATEGADAPPVKRTPKAKAAAAPVASVEAAVLFQVPEATSAPAGSAVTDGPEEAEKSPAKKAAKKAPAKKAAKKAPAKAPTAASESQSQQGDQQSAATPNEAAGEGSPEDKSAAAPSDVDSAGDSAGSDEAGHGSGDGEGSSNARRRRRRGGRRRRKPGGEGNEGNEAGEDNENGDGPHGSDAPESEAGGESTSADTSDGADKAGAGKAGAGKADSEKGDGDEASHDTPSEGGSSSSRRRRRRRRSGEGGGGSGDDPENTVTKVRKARSPEDEITAVSGSTRLEAKKQRRREGREAGRRRAPIVSEAEFLARRESVERVMAIRQRKDLIQIAVLEDKVLVEHYVARESQTSLIGNVYLGRVQNVLPSMEAAFIDIGKGRNAVLYAGEVNWQALGHKEGQPRKIESVLQSGQAVLVQVTKDPIGHKGARLTSQVSLAGRFLVYVPDGTTSGISRKLPDTERSRLKTLLKEIVPESAGVIVRTAAEGASEEELTRDVERLKARWSDIEGKVAKGNSPQLLYGEPDLTLKVVRDLFTEDFAKLVVQGDDAWQTVSEYVAQVAPDLTERLEHHESGEGVPDLFSKFRIDEQIAKGTDRKVWLPSGGSLIIDRTEAMTVVDVNTGKFTGSGGNLEETVTKNNLEAAEEIVRQLRLRDIGGIIVVDFIDMVLESNRDLVLRRLVECLGRDRTRHQVAEVTSLGLVQMTRKRIGTGLLEAFSETCTHCQGRGLMVHDLPIEPKRGGGDGEESRRGRRRKGGGKSETPESAPKPVPSPKDVAAMSKAASDEDKAASEEDAAQSASAKQESVKAAPVTDEPTSGEPTTDEPTKVAPVASAPAKVEPVKVEPAKMEPAKDEPAKVESAKDESAKDEQAASAPATTTVVTRTRRRAASRPAGPPAAEAAAGTDAGTANPTSANATTAESHATEPGPGQGRPEHDAPDPGSSGSSDAVSGTSEASDALEAASDEGHVEHVPIKKKDTRKR